MDLLDRNEPLNAITESRDAYVSLRQASVIDDDIQFRYAIDLLRTTKPEALNLSVKLLEELFDRTKDDGLRRDCLYYLSIAFTKLCKYEDALKCCDNILDVQPNNTQVLDMKTEIKNRARKDGFTGLAVVGGAVLGACALIGATVGLAVGLSKKR